MSATPRSWNWWRWGAPGMKSTPDKIPAGGPNGHPGPANRALYRVRAPASTPPGSLPRLVGRHPDLPGEPGQGEQPDEVVADVDLPPPQPVPGRRREGVVVVVPPLPQRQHPEHHVVAAVVPLRVRPAA